MLEKNPIIIKIHHDVTLKYLMFSINSHNLSIKLTKYSTNIDICSTKYICGICYRITIKNVHLPEADRLNTVVNSLRSAFPMINNDQEPPFIVCFL